MSESRAAAGVTRDIVQKLWRLCDILRDDGITYQAYVTELTYLLFLKMLAETQREGALPADARWASLTSRQGEALLTHYRALLLRLGTEGTGTVRTIFTDAQTSLRKPTNLHELVTQIDRLDWYSAKAEGLGDLYEGLLEKNAGEKKSGAGQYFTPRPLIDCIVRLLQPQPGEVVQDPAAGTGGFLVAADRAIKDRTDELFALKTDAQRFQREEAFRGLELVSDTHRLLLMNLMLHGIGGDLVRGGDAMGPDGETLGTADLILTNPPFGTKKGGGRPARPDFTITADTSNKQLAFVEHVVRGLRPGGRAGIVVPDNVLFADGAGRELRRWLLDVADLHTILRLPTGIFYAQGVKTNVLFLRRGSARVPKGTTQAVWVYDMRAGQPAYGKTRPLHVEDFAAFETAYGNDPNGAALRRDQGIEGCFRRFTRAEIEARGDNLDLNWLRSSEDASDNASNEPEDIMDRLRARLARARLATLRAAVLGKLTEPWRQARRDAGDIRTELSRIPAPEQGRGGREATTSVIQGTAALSVNDPGLPTPPGWAWTPLLRVARQESGHTPSRRVQAYWEGGDIPWVGIRDAGAHHGNTIHDTLQKCTSLGLENSSARLLPTGTVCLSRTASVGYVIVLGKPMATSQDFATWTCTAALLPEYLKYALLAEGDDIRRFGEGSSHTTIYFPEIRALHICLPPIAEQAEIVRLLTSAVGGHMIASDEAELALDLVALLEQSILARTFRSELVRQNQFQAAPAVVDADTPAPRRRARALA